MEPQSLKVTTREANGKGSARRLRAAGSVPAVLYGGGQGAVSIQMNARVFERLLHSHAGEHAVVQLEVENKPELSTPALLKLVHHHPVWGNVLHADFLRIRLDQRIVTRVPIRTQGQAQGVRDGGVLDHPLHEVELECLALEVPEAVVADVAALKIGESVTAGQLTLPDNVTLITDPEHTVAVVHAPRVVVEEAAEEAEEGVAAAEEEEAASPEVISEKKDKEEE